MNKDNAHLYLPLVQALTEGKIIESDLGSGWQSRREPDFTLPPDFYRIRPASFPPKPEGREWHNPDNLTAEQVKDGYRLLVKDEINNSCEYMKQIHKWDGESWDDSRWSGSEKSFTYRCPLSTPYPDGSFVKDGQLVKPWKPKFKVGDRVKHRNDVGTIEPYAIDTTGTHYYMVKFDNGFVDEKHEDDLEPAPEPKRVPLEPSDWIKDGPWWIARDEKDEHPLMVIGVSPFVVEYGNGSGCDTSHEDMMKLVRSNGKTLDPSGKPVWEECSKLA